MEDIKTIIQDNVDNETATITRQQYRNVVLSGIGAGIGFALIGSGGKYFANSIADGGNTKKGLIIVSIGVIIMATSIYYSPTIFKEQQSGFIKGERKCWCATAHGMEQCPCGGNSDKK